MSSDPTFDDLMSALGQMVGADLSPGEAGVVTVMAEGVRVTLEGPQESPYLYLHAPVASPGPDRAARLESAMAANLFGQPLSGAWLALDRRTDELVLCHSMQRAHATPVLLAPLIEAFAVAARSLQGTDGPPPARGEAADTQAIVFRV